MLNKLDRILLSENVCDEFYKNYNGDFKNWLLSILPEIEKCRKLEQDNPWHIYGCLDHILHSVEEINKQTLNLPIEERRKLAYVMFFHDIGKPDCYIRRYSKLYGRKIDSFFNHNLKSKEIADRVLDNLGFSNQEKQEIELLIEEHDSFMFIRLVDDGNPYHKVLTIELINEMIEKFNKVGCGEMLMNYLIKVGRADNMAQNPTMTKDSLILIDKMEERMQNCEKE